MKKKVLIKVYNSNGDYLGLWNDATFKGFEKKLNGGLGECLIELGKKFDYGGDDLVLGNHIEILIADAESVGKVSGDNYSTEIIYKGYISLIEPRVIGKKEGIIVHCLGHYTKLAQDIYKNGADTTIAEVATDVGVILRNVMDRYLAETTNPQLSYNDKTIEETGDDANYTFQMNTYREAFDKVLSLSPSGWFWWIDVQGKVWFKNKPTTPTHKFIFGKHFTAIKIQKSMEKIRNAMLFWNGEVGGAKIYKLYSDAASILLYDRRIQKFFDYGADLETTADLIGAKFLAENKDPEIRFTCKILDNFVTSLGEKKGYDIESINPGDTCSFFGFDSDVSNILRDNMLISRVYYTLNEVEITVEVKRSTLIEWQRLLNNRLDDRSGDGSPSPYTT